MYQAMSLWNYMAFIRALLVSAYAGALATNVAADYVSVHSEAAKAGIVFW